MKERPILFSGHMVRAILAGTKTQTRRVVKPAPQMVTDHSVQPWAGDARELLGLLIKAGKACPYGQPGDRLWVRETWNCFDGWAGYYYAADYEGFGIGPDDDPDHVPDHAVRWKPSIHMPRAASRINLDITSVRVERLHAISDADARAEGPAGHPDGPWHAFRSLWTLINGPESWDANPWVWVVEFKHLKGLQ